MSEEAGSRLPVPVIERAIKLSYAQAMLGAIYGASTGGMFIIGYALKLKADNVQIGLMSSIPMLCVVVQLLSSALVERGVSRRKLTLFGALLNVIGWVLIILIPYVAAKAPDVAKIAALIGIITLVTVFAQISGNARGSWIGDLIPAEYRGTFFGRLTRYAGIIGMVFALIEGLFLDTVKKMGIGAFSWLFGFGMLFGLANALLFWPQADVPMQVKKAGDSFMGYVKQTFANKALMLVMLYALLWSMQSIAGPFYATYLLRDLGMKYFNLGLLNAVVIVVMLLMSPFWGRMVDRYGCRPVLVICTLASAPLPLIWIWMHSVAAVNWAMPFIHIIVGIAISGITVALNTLVYKVTPSAGRSVQFAIYSIIVVLGAAPMPALGGHFPDWFHRIFPHADLRVTFYTSMLPITAAAIAAWYIIEPGAKRTRQMVKELPGHIRKPGALTGGG